MADLSKLLKNQRIQLRNGGSLTLLDNLGTGGFSTVLNTNDPKYIAKIIVKANQNVYRTFQKEVQFFKTIGQHQNIINCKDYLEQDIGKQGEFAVLVLEKCKRGNLYDVLEFIPGMSFQELQVAKIILDVAKALEVIHQKGYTHRDIKLENILMNEDGNYKLCDFGSATNVTVQQIDNGNRDEIQEDIENNTTEQYRCPEQLDLYSDFIIGNKVDIFALGVVIFILCFQKKPFDGKLASIKAHYYIPDIHPYSHKIKKLLQFMFQVDPRTRFSASQVVDYIMQEYPQLQQNHKAGLVNQEIFTQGTGNQIKPSFVDKCKKYLTRWTKKSEGWVVSALEENDQGPKQKYVRFLVDKAWIKREKVKKFYDILQQQLGTHQDNPVIVLKMELLLHNYFKKAPPEALQKGNNKPQNILTQIKNRWEHNIQKTKTDNQYSTSFNCKLIVNYANILLEKIKIGTKFSEVFQGNFSLNPFFTKKRQATQNQQVITPVSIKIIEYLLKYLEDLVQFHGQILEQYGIWNIQLAMVLQIADEEFCLISVLIHILHAFKQKTNYANVQLETDKENYMKKLKIFEKSFSQSFKSVHTFFLRCSAQKTQNQQTLASVMPKLQLEALDFILSIQKFSQSQKDYSIFKYLGEDKSIYKLRIPQSYEVASSNSIREFAQNQQNIEKGYVDYNYISNQNTYNFEERTSHRVHSMSSNHNMDQEGDQNNNNKQGSNKDRTQSYIVKSSVRNNQNQNKNKNQNKQHLLNDQQQSDDDYSDQYSNNYIQSPQQGSQDFDSFTNNNNIHQQQQQKQQQQLKQLENKLLQNQVDQFAQFDNNNDWNFKQSQIQEEKNDMEWQFSHQSVNKDFQSNTVEQLKQSMKQTDFGFEQFNNVPMQQQQQQQKQQQQYQQKQQVQKKSIVQQQEELLNSIKQSQNQQQKQQQQVQVQQQRKMSGGPMVIKNQMNRKVSDNMYDQSNSRQYANDLFDMNFSQVVLDKDQQGKNNQNNNKTNQIPKPPQQQQQQQQNNNNNNNFNLLDMNQPNNNNQNNNNIQQKQSQLEVDLLDIGVNNNNNVQSKNNSNNYHSPLQQQQQLQQQQKQIQNSPGSNNFSPNQQQQQQNNNSNGNNINNQMYSQNSYSIQQPNLSSQQQQQNPFANLQSNNHINNNNNNNNNGGNNLIHSQNVNMNMQQQYQQNLNVMKSQPLYNQQQQQQQYNQQQQQQQVQFSQQQQQFQNNSANNVNNYQYNQNIAYSNNNNNNGFNNGSVNLNSLNISNNSNIQITQNSNMNLSQNSNNSPLNVQNNGHTNMAKTPQNQVQSQFQQQYQQPNQSANKTWNVNDNNNNLNIVNNNNNNPDGGKDSEDEGIGEENSQLQQKMQTANSSRIRNNRNSGKIDIKDLLQNQISKNLDEPINVNDWLIDLKEVKLNKKIGSGHSSEVYKGSWKGINVAVKKMKIKSMSNSNFKEFQRELETLVKLRPQPNLVSLMGVSQEQQEQEDLYIITEYCSGGTLFDLLHRKPPKPLSWTQKLKLCKDIANGMAYLHSQNQPIIHRDLKSLNLLLDTVVQKETDRIQLKIADFGLARTQDTDLMTGQLGTFHWMAPEIFDNKPYTLKADVYSFAICIWEILSRETPYKGLQIGAIMKFVTVDQGRPDLKKIPKDAPQEIILLMKKCWDQNPEVRPNFKDIVLYLNQVKV